MRREHIIRIFAGALVTIGTYLGAFQSKWWLTIPAFVGLNLIQSAITKSCLLESILKRFSIGKDC